jgi:hypothetical protein
MENFSHTRKRIHDFVSQPRIASTLKFGMMLTLLVWIVIALFTMGEEDNRLTEAVNDLWSTATGDSSKPDATPGNEPPE